MSKIPHTGLTQEEEATLASLQARKAAVEQAKVAAADDAVRTFVGSPEFKALFPLAVAANVAAPLESRVHNMAVCMTQLVAMFPA